MSGRRQDVKAMFGHSEPMSGTPRFGYDSEALTELVANLEAAGAERWIEFCYVTGRSIEELFVRYLARRSSDRWRSFGE